MSQKNIYRADTNNRKKHSLPLLNMILIAAAAALVVVLFYCLGQKKQAQPMLPEPTPTPAPTAAPTPSPTPVPEPEPEYYTVRFSATGDNLIHDGVYKQAARRVGNYTFENTEDYDFEFCYQNLLDFYAQQDLNWINQETLITDTITPSTYPTFASPGELGRTLYDIGFRAFSISNNHSYDKGAAGIHDSMEYWQNLADDITVTGFYNDVSEGNEFGVAFREQDGITFAFVSYTEMTNGIPSPSNADAHVIYTDETDLIRDQITYAHDHADFVVVSCHWGNEDSHIVADRQRELAQHLSDWGADLIIGTHPHVVQTAEWLTGENGNRTFVAYSLGNSLSAQSKPNQMIGLLLTCNFEKTVQPDGSVELSLENPVFHPVIDHYDYGWSNIRLYLYSDYPENLANSHGVRSDYPQFGYDYINNVLETYVGTEFLE